MPRTDRTAVCFALIALAMRCKAQVLTAADFLAPGALIGPLPPDDLLRLGFDRLQRRWHDARHDADAMFWAGKDLARVVERDQWPKPDARVA